MLKKAQSQQPRASPVGRLPTLRVWRGFPRSPSGAAQFGGRYSSPNFSTWEPEAFSQSATAVHFNR